MFIRAMTGFVACGLLLSGSTAFADPGGWKSERYYSRYNSEYDYADVVNVDPIIRRVRISAPPIFHPCFARSAEGAMA